jgi:hypothetical protein
MLCKSCRENIFEFCNGFEDAVNDNFVNIAIDIYCEKKQQQLGDTSYCYWCKEFIEIKKTVDVKNK